jgi:hypothetical protein
MRAHVYCKPLVTPHGDEYHRILKRDRKRVEAECEFRGLQNFCGMAPPLELWDCPCGQTFSVEPLPGLKVVKP